jgi:preprotein translocase subunit SecG
MSTLITILHVIVCLFLMLTVLLQSGKGGGMGAAFGGGNAATVFGGSGASSFLRRLTAGAGTIFILTSMLLAFLASHNSADALEKFGEQQEKLASEKDAAKKKAMQGGPGSGSSAGSASGSGSASPTMMTPFTPNQGSAADSAGSASAPATGSSAAPAESPAPSSAPAEAPPADTTKPADSKPADTKPADTKPADAAKPAGSAAKPK